MGTGEVTRYLSAYGFGRVAVPAGLREDGWDVVTGHLGGMASASAQRVAQQPGVLGRLARTATFGHRDDLSDLALGAAPRDALDGK